MDKWYQLKLPPIEKCCKRVQGVAFLGICQEFGKDGGF